MKALLRNSICSLGVGAVLSLTGAQALAQSRDYISIVGSSTVYPFTTVVAERFGRSTGVTTPKVESTGTGGGMKLFCAGVGTAHPDLTGAQNARFIARIYGVDTEAMIEFVQDFAELGGQFHQPMRSYSSGMRSRVAFGVSMAVPFDTYLIDEVTSVGDANFKDKSARVLHARLEHSSALMVSHSIGMIREICTAGAVLDGGQLSYYTDLEQAIAHHMHNMRAAAAGRHAEWIYLLVSKHRVGDDDGSLATKLAS